MLTLHLFGPPQLFIDGEPVNVTRRKSRALLYYLAAHAEPLTRDQILRFFWPDTERAAAQQTLRTTLYGLRKALGEALLVDEERLSLAPDSQVDVRRFEANLSPPVNDLPLLSETLDLYRGEFLEDVALPDTPEFEEWALVERERYQRLMIRGLTALSRLYESHHQSEAALDTLRRALALDPFQEDLQRAALRLHYLTGDRAGAISALR
ncbi:MAG: winged helix-turn-helix domain-containing protein [Ardenticatenales bacterium]|nr:winged helix-turn-helix domain-containing protein [Ardenticatenales bacterium]